MSICFKISIAFSLPVIVRFSLKRFCNSNEVVDVNSVEHTAVFEIPSAGFVGQYVVSDKADFPSIRHRDEDFGLVHIVSDDVECDEIVTVEKVEFGKIAFFGFARVGNCVFHRVHLRNFDFAFRQGRRSAGGEERKLRILPSAVNGAERKLLRGNRAVWLANACA